MRAAALVAFESQLDQMTTSEREEVIRRAQKMLAEATLYSLEPELRIHIVMRTANSLMNQTIQDYDDNRISWVECFHVLCGVVRMALVKEVLSTRIQSVETIEYTKRGTLGKVYRWAKKNLLR